MDETDESGVGLTNVYELLEDEGYKVEPAEKD